MPSGSRSCTRVVSGAPAGGSGGSWARATAAGGGWKEKEAGASIAAAPPEPSFWPASAAAAAGAAVAAGAAAAAVCAPFGSDISDRLRLRPPNEDRDADESSDARLDAAGVLPAVEAEAEDGFPLRVPPLLVLCPPREPEAEADTMARASPSESSY